MRSDQQHIHALILQALARVAPGALPENSLLTGLNLEIRPVLDRAELSHRLSWLLDQGFVKKLPGALDPKVFSWLITQEGKNTLAALSL